MQVDYWRTIFLVPTKHHGLFSRFRTRSIGFCNGSSGSICITYAIDSYPKVASEGIVLMLFIRNMMGMGFSYAILPWINRNGLVVVTWLMFMLSIIINGSFIVMLVFGKRFRRWTAAHYEKFLSLDMENSLNVRK